MYVSVEQARRVAAASEGFGYGTVRDLARRAGRSETSVEEFLDRCWLLAQVGEQPPRSIRRSYSRPFAADVFGALGIEAEEAASMASRGVELPDGRRMTVGTRNGQTVAQLWAPCTCEPGYDTVAMLVAEHGGGAWAVTDDEPRADDAPDEQQCPTCGTKASAWDRQVRQGAAV